MEIKFRPQTVNTLPWTSVCFIDTPLAIFAWEFNEDRIFQGDILRCLAYLYIWSTHDLHNVCPVALLENKGNLYYRTWSQRNWRQNLHIRKYMWVITTAIIAEGILALQSFIRMYWMGLKKRKCLNWIFIIMEQPLDFLDSDLGCRKIGVHFSAGSDTSLSSIE